MSRTCAIRSSPTRHARATCSVFDHATRSATRSRTTSPRAAAARAPRELPTEDDRTDACLPLSRPVVHGIVRVCNSISSEDGSSMPQSHRTRVRTIEWNNGRVVMIDQRLLPTREVYRVYTTYREVARAIKEMVIRGAPAIGVAAAMGIALGVRSLRREELRREFDRICRTFAATRPT